MLYEISDERFWTFAETCRGHAEASTTGIVLSAYATLAKQGGCSESEAPDKELQEEISHHLGGNLSWLPVGEYSDDELRAIIMKNDVSSGRASAEYSTPRSMALASIGLLKMETGKSILDLGCGLGGFMMEAVYAAKPASFAGVEVNFDAASVCRIRAKFLPVRADITLGSLFDFSGKFDYVFCDGPWGVPKHEIERQFGDAASSLIPDGIPVRSGAWLLALAALKCCRDGGRAVVTMPGGPLFNSSDSEIREHLVRSGRIESVIALPQGLYLPYTSLPTYLVVLSKGNNSVRMVDASKMGRKERRATVLTGEDVARICKMADPDADIADTDSNCVADVDATSIEESDWSLAPSRYTKVVNIPNGVPLASLALSITRGASISARELDSRIVKEKTPYRYLQIKDLSSGEISRKLPYLSSIEEKELKYCVEDGDIVLGKMSPFRAAVASVKPGEYVLATGNLYIIRLDKDAVNPVYLKVFLESPEGMAQLKAACVGAKIPSIPTSAFKRILIPPMSLESQRKIAEQYRALRQTIDVYELKIERAKDEMASLLEEAGE
jgi:type I restriction enzyme M protein